MKSSFKKSLCILLSAVLIAAGIPCRVCAVENGITVYTRDEFMVALKQKKNPITVSGLITIGDTADDSGAMLPIMIPAGTEIRGEGDTAHLNSRAPIQLEGDVSFHNMELTFESTDALGSVPHREIFLAGHSLTFDNIKTWLEGGNNEFGPIGGTEKELLPTVYAGGFTNTNIGANASLTVKNSNADTMFQAVYMGHDAGNDKKVPYYGSAELNLDSKLTVREKVDVSKNSRADIHIAGGENDTAKTKEFSGNENTTLTLSKSSLADAVLDNIGSIILTDKACLSPISNTFQNITLRRGGCLDLNGVSDAMNVIISGNFTGVSDSEEEKGILVVNQQSSLVIEGTVTGTTQFQTYHRLFPGTLLLNWPYISVNREQVNRSNFVLAQKSIDNYGYQMKYSNGLWTVVKPEQEAAKEIGSIEVVSAPSQVLLDSIKRQLDSSVPDETVYFDIVWKDVDGNALSAEEADERMLYESDCIFKVKTEYWESDDPAVLSKTDWGNSIFLTPSDTSSGRYYLQAEADAKAGDYTFLFCSDYIDEPLNTVQDVKNLGSRILAEKCVTFLNQEPDSGETPVPTVSPVPTISPVPTEIPAPTGEPGATSSPAPTKVPVPTEEPGTTSSPAPTKVPAPTEKPGTTSSPVPTKIPAPTEKPGGSSLPPGKPEASSLPANKPDITARPEPVVSQTPSKKVAEYPTATVYPKGTKILRLSSIYRGFVVRWKKQTKQTTGYQLQYSTSRKFGKKAAKTITIKGNKKNSKKITVRTPGKKYFVRIRTYQSVKVNGRTKMLYSAWSKVRTVKTR